MILKSYKDSTVFVVFDEIDKTISKALNIKGEKSNGFFYKSCFFYSLDNVCYFGKFNSEFIVSSNLSDIKISIKKVNFFMNRFFIHNENKIIFSISYTINIFDHYFDPTFDYMDQIDNDFFFFVREKFNGNLG